MPGNKIETTEDVIAVSDPGDINRDEHLWGDRLMVQVGNVFAWLFPILMIAIVTQVVIRRVGFNQAWLDEAQWWMYGAAMLVGFGFAITTESHVRVDIFHQNFTQKRKSRIETFALGWMLIPFLILMTDVMIHYAISSWKTWEGSDAPNGLHMLFLLKTLLPILFGIAIIAASSALIRHLRKWNGLSPIWILIGAFPAIWFACERVIFYALYWIMLGLNPDLTGRKVLKLPIMENTFWFGLAATLVVAGLFRILSQRKAQAV